MFSPRSVSLFGSLFVLLSASTAAAVTGSVCLRNDGVGTFSSNDLTVYAISIPSSGFGQAWGPSSSLAPGSGVCITVNGLNAWTGFQYQYVFDISFTDSTGTVTFSSGTNLQLGSSGTQYISANGVSTVQPLLADYISIANQAPPVWGSMNAYANWPNDTTECYVSWTGLTSTQWYDFNYSELERATSPGGPWTLVSVESILVVRNRIDVGRTPGTTYYYRLISVDDYGATSTSGSTDCTTATAIVDADGDGYTSDVDCDDGDIAVNPGATEVCNGVDDDCNDLTDDADPGVTGAPTWYVDGDADGWGDTAQPSTSCDQPASTASQDGDCDDDDPDIHPTATELCDGIDDDCDTVADNGWPDFDSDGDADCIDEDDDDDGITDAVEESYDVDGDGAPDLDVDGDGDDNRVDLDSDDDGIDDEVEGTVDDDGDGIPAFLDPDDAQAGDDDDDDDDDDDAGGGGDGPCGNSVAGAEPISPVAALLALVLGLVSVVRRR